MAYVAQHPAKENPHQPLDWRGLNSPSSPPLPNPLPHGERELLCSPFDKLRTNGIGKKKTPPTFRLAGPSSLSCESFLSDSRSYIPISPIPPIPPPGAP